MSLSRTDPFKALGLTAGAGFIFLTGTTRVVSSLVLAMTIFGFCKSFYDANIFASLYDVIPPRARATAAGVMNAVGWLGGACAPVSIGWLATRNGPDREVASLSDAIAFGSVIYLIGAALLVLAIVCFAKRDILATRQRSVTAN